MNSQGSKRPTGRVIPGDLTLHVFIGKGDVSDSPKSAYAIHLADGCDVDQQLRALAVVSVGRHSKLQKLTPEVSGCTGLYKR